MNKNDSSFFRRFDRKMLQTSALLGTVVGILNVCWLFFAPFFFRFFNSFDSFVGKAGFFPNWILWNVVIHFFILRRLGRSFFGRSFVSILGPCIEMAIMSGVTIFVVFGIGASLWGLVIGLTCAVAIVLFLRTRPEVAQGLYVSVVILLPLGAMCLGAGIRVWLGDDSVDDWVTSLGPGKYVAAILFPLSGVSLVGGGIGSLSETGIYRPIIFVYILLAVTLVGLAVYSEYSINLLTLVGVSGLWLAILVVILPAEKN